MSAPPDARTVPALVDELAARHGQREALVGGGRRLSYAALREEVRACARGLLALGVAPGDKVALLMGNLPEWIIADFAATAIGAVMVGVNTWATARELEHVLAHSDTRVLITSGDFLKADYLAMLDAMQPRAARLPALREVVLVGPRRHPGCRGWAEVLAAGAAVDDATLDAAMAAVAPTDVAYLLYTSGSTALPKGVLLQHYALIENMWHIGERQHVSERDRVWLAVSMFWSFACENALFNVVTHGGCIVLQEHFDAGEALALIERERCTLFYGTPNMAQALYEHPERATRDLSCLRSGATLGSAEQIMRVVELGAREICNIYGLTETYGNCTVTDAGDPLELRLRSVGRALPGVELRIVDADSGAECAAGEAGEIRVRGYVLTEYFKDPAQTAAAFDAAGYFRTGDIGYLDADGYLYFRGRSKEMVKTGGINVAPVEIEEILLAHPAVKLAFCTGVPDAVRDEIIGAVIVTRPGAEVTAAALVEHCRAALAAYKVPRLLRFVAEHELPLTTTGKLQKNRLAATFFSEHDGRAAS
ncbi:MAG: AMP-binding protein [Gammaproteobacteria bacterium]|nr:AMP-binding protein [Gammaproteobacteria bacterium]